MRHKEVIEKGGVYLSDMTGDKPNKGIAPENWDKLHRELKQYLTENDYEAVKIILDMNHTRYI